MDRTRELTDPLTFVDIIVKCASLLPNNPKTAVGLLCRLGRNKHLATALVRGDYRDIVGIE